MDDQDTYDLSELAKVEHWSASSINFQLQRYKSIAPQFSAIP